MKFSLILVLSLAAVLAAIVECKKDKKVSASASKEKTGHAGHGCIATIAHTLDSINKNVTARDAVVAALDAAQLDQYLAINGTTTIVNTTLIASTVFTSAPVIAPVVSSLVSEKVHAKINKLLNNIEQLKTNQTVINHLISFLYEHDLIVFVSGTTGSQTIDYAGLQQKAPELLACHTMDLGHHKGGNKKGK